MAPLGLDMVLNNYKKKNCFKSIFNILKGISVGKRSAGVPSAIGRHNLNDEELVN
jgi:hypothetical protein